MIARIPVSDSNVTNPAEIARLSKQSKRVIDMLKRGPMTTVDFHDEGIRQHNARIAECRNVGWDIECYERDLSSGLCWYRLNNPDGPELKDFTVPTRIWGGDLEAIDAKLTVRASSWAHAKNLVRFRTVHARAIEDLHSSVEAEEEDEFNEEDQ